MLTRVRWAGRAASWRRGRARERAGPPDQPRSSAVSPPDWPAAIRAGLLYRTGGTRSTISYDDALAVICGATGWPVGHVWVHGPTGWQSSGSWYSLEGENEPGEFGGYAALREATASTDLGSGRGIVAAVLHLESCRFLPGLEGLGSPIRQAHATALRLRGVVGIPVHSVRGDRRKVTAILEFVTVDEVEPDGALAEALLEVAARSRRRVVRKANQVAHGRATPPDVDIPDHLAG
jgi:hypothetical protein